MVPATPEIYTHRHTLSLHGALPICGARRDGGKYHVEVIAIDFGEAPLVELGQRIQWFAREVGQNADHQWQFFLFDGIADFHVIGDLDAGRSEEHTSELQSLMRNSYAVFCLKKKIRPSQTVDN